MSAIAGSRDASRQAAFYSELERLLRLYCITPLLSFDNAAALKFQDLQRARVRIGTMDLKIAAIALANNAILLNRNTSDFEQVPGFHFEDWTT